MYCNVRVTRHVDPKNHYLFLVELELTNPSEVDAEIKWELKIPSVFKTRETNTPLEGTETVQPRMAIVVARRIIDTLNLADHVRAELIERNPIVAKLPTVAMGGSVLGDSCFSLLKVKT